LAAASAAKEVDAELVVTNVITVPDQTSLAQEVVYEEERIERQRELLEQAEDIAQELGVGLRTRAIVGRDVGETILHVIEQENADDVVMGWSGTRKRRERVLGSNIDKIIERAPCEVTLVRPGTNESTGDVVAFVSEGPYSSVIVQKAAAFVRAEAGASLTLVNVQPPVKDEDPTDAVERGRSLIEETAQTAGVKEYDSDVVVTEDIESEIVSIAREYDTTVLGVSRASSVERVLSGAIPETIGDQVSGTVVLVRSGEKTRRSLRSAIIQRLSS